MSTKDQLLYSDLHGTAMRFAAEGRNLAESIAELREMAYGRDDILAEAAGITAGSYDDRSSRSCSIAASSPGLISSSLPYGASATR
jgi:hypothetical protein